MEAVGAFPAQDLQGQVERQVVLVRPGQAQMADPDFRLHRVCLVDHDQAPGRRRRRGMVGGRQGARLPVAKGLLGGGQGLGDADIADDAQQGVVGNEPGRVELAQVLGCDGRQRLGRAGVGQPVGVEPVHEPVEDQAGDRVGVLEIDAHARQRLLALTIELFGAERRPPDDVGEQLEAEGEAVFHHQDVGHRQVAARAGVEPAADGVDGIGNLRRVAGPGALVQQRRRQGAHALLAGRILGAAGADQQAQRDHRLLVMLHDDDLQAVGQRLDLVGRKVDLARRQRARRTLDGPVGHLRAGHRRHEHGGSRGSRPQPPARPCGPPAMQSGAGHCVAPFGMIVITSRLVGVK